MPAKSKNIKANKKNNNKNNNKDKNDIDIDIVEDLSWIDDMQKDLDKATNKAQQKKSQPNKKQKSNKTENKNLSTKINTYLTDENSVSDSDSETLLNSNVKNKTINNRFGFVNSESDTDTESENDDNKSINEFKSKPINKFGFIDTESNTESDTESNTESDTESNTETKTNNDIKPETDKKQISNIDNQDMNISINCKNKSNTNLVIDEKLIETKKISEELSEEILEEKQQTKYRKLTKKQRIEQKSQAKQAKQEKKNGKSSQYKFDLNSNSKTTNSMGNISNNLTTLYAEVVEVLIGGKTLISSSNITINSGLKYFVLGSNGIGKTTLLKQIYSNLIGEMDVLMLDQDIQLETTEQTISQFILGADTQLYNAKKRMDELEQKEEMDDNENNEYLGLSEIIYQKEWDKYEAESNRIINGLGFSDSSIPVSILSGGKRMILAIGKALLRKPEILMLDEPTNHLDLDVVIWLTDYLAGYKKTLVIITHQIGLVNSLADVIWYVGNPELTGNKVYTIRGHYDRLSKFLEDKEKETCKTYEKFSKRVDELRKKSTPKKDVEEFIKKEGVPRPPKPYTVNITFDNVVELSTKNIIEFKEVAFGYPNSNPIYTKLDISLGMGSRMILVGPNGCGKTTFFKLASGQIKPNDGYVIADERLRVGYYNQQIVDHLPLNLNSIEYLQSLNPKLNINQCRTILGKLGIKKVDNLDLPTNKIGNLSGGQKARVSFGGVQMSNPHLILLDEPTNHLDLESIEGLIKGINDFNGGVVIITHDMYLIESIERADIYQVKSSDIIKFPGDFEEYCEMITNK